MVAIRVFPGRFAQGKLARKARPEEGPEHGTRFCETPFVLCRQVVSIIHYHLLPIPSTSLAHKIKEVDHAHTSKGSIQRAEQIRVTSTCDTIITPSVALSFLSLQATRITQARAKQIYTKHFDADNLRYYWYNTQIGTTLWEKPAGLCGWDVDPADVVR